MNVSSKMPALRAGVGVLLPGLLLCGCSAMDANRERRSIEHQIATARSSADYERVAAWYDREAAAALEMARRHHRMLDDIYRPAYAGPTTGPYRNPSFVRHCANLARDYEEAAQDSSALAALYRQLAAESKS